MQMVSVHRQLEAPARAVWGLIRQGGGVDRWLPVIASCQLEGSGAGARRVCTTVHGHVLDETIEAVDEASRVFQYRIAHVDMLPVADFVGTMHVSDGPGGKAQVLWIGNFELRDPGAADAVRAAITEMYGAGLAGLDALARKG